MTSGNIKKVQITAKLDDGTIIISQSDNRALIAIIAEMCQFQHVKMIQSQSEEAITDCGDAYFSEQAVRDAALDMLNTSYADSNFDKAIDFMIEQLKGGEK